MDNIISCMKKEKKGKNSRKNKLQETPERPPTRNICSFLIDNTHDYLFLITADVIYFNIFFIFKEFMHVQSFKFLKRKKTSLFFTVFVRKTIYHIGQMEVRLK